MGGWASDRYGRRPVILFSSVTFIAGAVMLTIAKNYYMLLGGRFVLGLGVGLASMSMPVYVSEASEPSMRGFLVTCINVAITFGQFFSACIDGAFSNVVDGWRYMLGLAAVPALIQLIGFWYVFGKWDGK